MVKIHWVVLNAHAARAPAASWGAKCIQESAKVIFPAVTSEAVTAGLNEASEMSPTVSAPASTTKAIWTRRVSSQR